MERGYNHEEAKACMALNNSVYSNYNGIWDESPDHDNFKVVLDSNSTGAYTLCIRGTVPSKIKDLIIDVQVFKKMHFPIEMNTKDLKPRVSAGLTTMFEQLTPKLLLRLESISGGCDLFITGHSQGGAAASLFALWIEHTFPGKFQIKTYIFAPPSIGNKDFSTIVQQYIPYGVYRVVNPLDTIPYFFVNIKALINSNTPRRIPIFFKLLYFFKRSRISVRSSSSLVGGNGAGGAISSSFLLFMTKLKNLTRKKKMAATTKRKFTTSPIKRP